MTTLYCVLSQLTLYNINYMSHDRLSEINKKNFYHMMLKFTLRYMWFTLIELNNINTRIQYERDKNNNITICMCAQGKNPSPLIDSSNTTVL